MKLNSAIERQLQRIEQRAQPYAVLAYVKRIWPNDVEEQEATSYFLVWLATWGAIVEPGPELRSMAERWAKTEPPKEEESWKLDGIPLEDHSDDVITRFLCASLWSHLSSMPSELVLPDGRASYLSECRHFLDEPDRSDSDLIAQLERDHARLIEENKDLLRL